VSLLLSHCGRPTQAVRYIELLPPEKRPVAGSEGAAYRRQQMACQLPEHDQDPSKCHELSPAEVKQMEQYVRKYKDEALGMGDVRLPEEMALVRAAAGGPGGPGAAGGGRGGVGAAGSEPGATSAKAGVGAGYGPGVPGAPAGASSAQGSGTGGTGAPWPGSEAGLGPGEPGSGQGGTLTAAGALGVPGLEAAGAQQSFVSNLSDYLSLSHPTAVPQFILFHIVAMSHIKMHF